MIDTNKALRDYLVSQSAITGQVSTRVFWPRLPANWSLQKAIVFMARGGDADQYFEQIEPSYQFHCYGATSIEAREVYRALFDVLHDKANVYISAASAYLWHSFEEVQGQDGIDPDTNWPFVLTFFTLRFSTN